MDKRVTKWQNFPLIWQKSWCVSQLYLFNILCIFYKKLANFLAKIGKNYWRVNYLVQFYVFLPLKLQIYWFDCHIFEIRAVKR